MRRAVGPAPVSRVLALPTRPDGRQFEPLYEATSATTSTGDRVHPRAARRACGMTAALDRRIDAAAAAGRPTGWPCSNATSCDWPCGSCRRRPPAAVVIDEAVGLAKRYASPEAAVLVNGILGKIARRKEWEREHRHGTSAGRPRGAAPRLEEGDLRRGRRPSCSSRMTEVAQAVMAEIERQAEALDRLRSYLRGLAGLASARARSGHPLLAARRQADPPAAVPGRRRAAGGDAEPALPVAGAIEMVQAFSLVHDDLPALDDDVDAPRPAHQPRPLRRGRRGAGRRRPAERLSPAGHP